MVIAPNKDGQWKECHEPDEIFAALIKEYKAKYHQTENTPPMTYPLQHYLGYLGNKQASLEVLDGRLPPIPGIRPYSL